MAKEMQVPAVGESITEVTVALWNKNDGDFVKTDEILCELESDKATFEFPAEMDGILRIVAKEGEVLPIGAVLCTIEPSSSSESVSAPSTPTVEPKVADQSGKAEIIEIKVPEVGESISEVTVASWNKANGDSVALDEVICELESDKATFEMPAEVSGKLEILVEPGTVVPIGGLIAKITKGAGSAPAASPAAIAPEPSNSSNASSSSSTYAANHPSPAAGKILEEKGINPNEVNGTGVGGRITKEDALKAEKSAVAASPAQSQANPAPVASPSGDRGQSRERMSSLRKTVARRLVAVKNETAMLTTFNEVDMKPVMDLRKKYKDSFKEKHGVGLGFMSFFTKAVCIALKEFPAVNAQIDGEEIVYHDYCDVSIAVSAPKGLMVPVIRNAEKLSLAGIESEVIRLATKARDNKLTLEDMSGGTFTITNGGVFGSMLSTPIINAPQVAILGMHNIVERPVVINGEVVVRPIMYLALSYDHRIIDGKESVSFLVRIKQLLEDPSRMLLDI
ncbi:MAG: hypothetical protein RIR51_220 [Bacteroidota bacterium]|jgi:2-oxoglutarate dehydrogenase E2 component (dihydrolipoamide succinyltransferase)